MHTHVIHAVTLISSMLWRMVFISSNTLNKPAATSNLFLLSSNCSNSDRHKFEISSHLTVHAYMYTWHWWYLKLNNITLKMFNTLNMHSLLNHIGNSSHNFYYNIYVCNLHTQVHMTLCSNYKPFHDLLFAMIIFWLQLTGYFEQRLQTCLVFL